MDDGLVVQQRSGAVPRLKRYLDEMKGNLTLYGMTLGPSKHNPLSARGTPTQKPLALLERIIAASSNEGDMVLDPFAGCATACIAADKLGRQWVGVDLSSKAVELVNMRLQDYMGNLFHHRLVTARTDIPKRTDIDARFTTGRTSTFCWEAGRPLRWL